jgi:hypothetical protein
LSVNGFFTDEMALYTMYQSKHAELSEKVDNRIIGPLFKINIPDKWHLVDIWNKRPVEVQAKMGMKYAFLPQEMPEDLGCIIAIPQLIRIVEEDKTWKASLPEGKSGTLELIGIDMTKRNQIGPIVPADKVLTFDQNTVEYSTDGYVQIQYRDTNKEVQDVALVQVAF